MTDLRGAAMPSSLTKERPANNLASLTISDGLQTLSAVLIDQWTKKSAFRELERFGIRPIDRCLFYGPPGNGKTMAAQLIASKLDCPLYRVCCEAMVTSAFGGTPKNVGDVLDWVSAQGTAVILWDECESLFPDRESSRQDACTRELVSSMQIFWQRLDRWSTPQLHVMATNLVERLDPALLSRIDLKLEFGPPTLEQSLDVLAYWSEALHQYGAEQWSPLLRDEIERGRLPVSFRDLWQSITSAVRAHVTQAD